MHYLFIVVRAHGRCTLIIGSGAWGWANIQRVTINKYYYSVDENQNKPLQKQKNKKNLHVL